MKKRNKEILLIGVILIGLSIFLHYMHYVIFKDLHHTLIFLVADIAFIPMEVFFTSVVIEKFLEKREKSHMVEKLNMLIGIFYSELGTIALENITEADSTVELLRSKAIVNKNWNKNDFKNLEDEVKKYTYSIDIKKINLMRLKEILDLEKNFLINLISNPMLLEHEYFTEMLMSLMHLREELDSRYSKSNMEDYELEHIKIDINIAYKFLTVEWVYYMKHLKDSYPQLFLKALINNPFDKRSKFEKDLNHMIKI